MAISISPIIFGYVLVYARTYCPCLGFPYTSNIPSTLEYSVYDLWENLKLHHNFKQSKVKCDFNVNRLVLFITCTAGKQTFSKHIKQF